MRVTRTFGLMAFLAMLSTGGRARAQTPGPPGAAPAAATKPMIVVHIDAPPEVELQVNNGNDDWETLCRAPCDRPVPATDAYRVTSLGMRASSTFHLDPGSRVTLHIDPTSAGGHAASIAVTITGAVAMVPIVGTTALLAIGELFGVILFCPIATAFVSKDQQNSEYGKCLGDIGSFFAKGYAEPWVWIPAVAGVGMLAGGTAWWVGTPPSRVTQSAAASAWVPSPAGIVAGAGRVEALRIPPAAVVPVLDLRF